MPDRLLLLVHSEARALLRSGWQAIPIQRGTKAPRLKNWQNLRLTERNLRLHFRSGDNIGVLLGQVSGDLVDVDLDAPQALTVADTFLPTTSRVHGRKTKPRSHRWYKSSGLHQPEKFMDTDGTCLVEMRSNGQQTLVPPSIHPNGEQLCWESEGDPAPVDSAELSRAVALVAAASLVARHWPHRGSRHEASLALQGFLLRSNFTQHEAGRFVSAVTLAAGDEEWASRAIDARTTAQRLADGRAATGRTRLAQLIGKKIVEIMSTWLAIKSMDIAVEAYGLNRTDVGNARRFVLAHGVDIRFCHALRKWLIYDGRRWVEDDTGEVRRRAKQAVQSMLSEAAAEPDDEKRKKLVVWQLQSEFENRLKALVSLAESENGIPIRVGELDLDPELFNCQNGTLDLRTRILREHRHVDLITKMSPVVYRENAECPHWCKFLNRITGGNAESISFLQRITAYSLTGDTREQVLFLLYGTGANGKTTFLEVLRYIWGDYARGAEFSSFVASRGSNVRNDLARLAGARLVTAAESEFKRHLAEAVVKQITGGDTITARFLYSEHFEFRPQFKLFLATNHKPRIRGTDVAIWRRIHLIPFTVTIPKEEQDKDLLQKLRREAPGILCWALQGLAAWHRDGLAPPATITRATSEYRSEEDVLQHFFDERCVLDADAQESASELYTAYWTWCEAVGESPMCKRDFGLSLQERALQSTRNARSRKWIGVRLLEGTSVTHDALTGLCANLVTT